MPGRAWVELQVWGERQEIHVKDDWTHLTEAERVGRGDANARHGPGDRGSRPAHQPGAAAHRLRPDRRRRAGRSRAPPQATAKRRRPAGRHRPMIKLLAANIALT